MDSHFEQYIGTAINLKAYAKLNLRLKLEGRRSDGYHLLSMINVLTELADDITVLFYEGTGCTLEVVGPYASPEITSPETNLACMALRRYFSEYNVPLAATIRLEKNIPLGSGLGGGSSDGAAVLLGLSELFAEGLSLQTSRSVDELKRDSERFALEMGADLPYFLKGKMARVTGIGERIENYDSKFLSGESCWLALPKCQVSTKIAYEALRQARPEIPSVRDLPGEQFGEMLRINTAAVDYEPTPSRTVKASLRRQLWPLVENDLESIVASKFPEIGVALTALRAIKGVVVGMTGSGSAIFILPRTIGFLQSEEAAEVTQAVEKLGLSLIKSSLK